MEDSCSSQWRDREELELINIFSETSIKARSEGLYRNARMKDVVHAGEVFVYSPE